MPPLQRSEQKEFFLCGQERAWCFSSKVALLLIKIHGYFKLRPSSLIGYKVPTVPTEINRFWAPSRAPQNWALHPEHLASIHITWTRVVQKSLNLYINCLLNCTAYRARCCVHLFVLIASTIGYFVGWNHPLQQNSLFLIKNNSGNEYTIRICTKKKPFLTIEN